MIFVLNEPYRFILFLWSVLGPLYGGIQSFKQRGRRDRGRASHFSGRKTFRFVDRRARTQPHQLAHGLRLPLERRWANVFVKLFFDQITRAKDNLQLDRRRPVRFRGLLRFNLFLWELWLRSYAITHTRVSRGKHSLQMLFLFLGKYSEAGCTLKFILDWAWDSISNIKQAVDKVSQDIF